MNRQCSRRRRNSLAKSATKALSFEDNLVISAEQKHGLNWPLLSQEVITRTPDQCSNDRERLLDPDINYPDWIIKEDEDVRREVLTHGTNWKTISTIYEPELVPDSPKSRYCTLIKAQKTAKKTACQEKSSSMLVVPTATAAASPSPTPPRRNTDAAGPSYRRGACKRCRARRIRCEKAPPGHPCAACAKLSIDCRYSRVKLPSYRRGACQRCRARKIRCVYCVKLAIDDRERKPSASTASVGSRGATGDSHEFTDGGSSNTTPSPPEEDSINHLPTDNDTDNQHHSHSTLLSPEQSESYSTYTGDNDAPHTPSGIEIRLDGDGSSTIDDARDTTETLVSILSEDYGQGGRYIHPILSSDNQVFEMPPLSCVGLLRADEIMVNGRYTAIQDPAPIQASTNVTQPILHASESVSMCDTDTALNYTRTTDSTQVDVEQIAPNRGSFDHSLAPTNPDGDFYICLMPGCEAIYRKRADLQRHYGHSHQS